MYQLSTQTSIPTRVSKVLPRTNLPPSMRYLFAFVFMLLAGVKSYGQIYMTTGSSSTCSNTFYDSNGPSANYNNSENYTYTIYPGTVGSKVIATFTSLATESGWDYFYVYNGNSTGAPLLGSYTGTIASPPTFTSTATDGSLTFKFTSDASVTAAGWAANITCLSTSACSGTMSGGAATASSTTACPGKPITLNLTGSSGGTGITYQWYSSPTGLAGSWTAVSGATTVSYVILPPAGTTTYYQCTVTCAASSSTGTSTSVAVAVSTAATVPYSETFETTPAGSNVACAAVSSTWDGLYSGSPAGGYNWTLLDFTYAGYMGSNHTPGGTKYIAAGYYVGSYAGYTAQYWFTPGIALTSGKTYRFSYWYRVGDYMATYYASTGSVLGMYYNTTQSTTGLVAIKPDLPAYGSSTYAQNVGDFSVPTSGTYNMAIKVDNKGYGYYGGGIIDDIGLIELPACTTATATTFGTGGKAKASPNVMCSVPAATTLSLSGTPPFSGLDFSWEVAVGSPTTFTSAGITAATGAYTIPTGGVYYFRCKVNCTATGLSSYSDTAMVITTPITPPYTETFEGGTAGVNMPCASYTFSWSSGSYWYLQGSPYASYTPGIVNHTPGGSKYLHAGYALGNVSSGGDELWFTPGLALTAAKAYNVSFWYSNSAYSTSYSTIGTKLGVRAGNAQTKAAMTIIGGADTVVYNNAVMTPTYGQFTRGFIAPSTGTYYVGLLVNNSGYSYYGMAIDDIGVNILPPCSAKPAAGTAVATPSLICTTGTSTLNLIGTSLASDLTFQWDSSVVSATGPWTPVVGGVGATSPGYTTATLTTGPVYYRCRITCTAIGAPNTDSSVAAVVNVGAIALPYVETFESGTSGVNMPCAAVAGTWSTAITYWSLKDGPYSTSYPGAKNHTTGGTKYITSGYYNGPYYGSGENFFWFTPALKMTAGKGYQVSFWYNGAGYSTGYNGLKLGIYAGTAQSAAGMTIRAGGLDSFVDASVDKYAQMTRSFVAPTTGNYYVGIKTVNTGYNYPMVSLDDIGVTQLPDCSGKPVAGTADATAPYLCAAGTTYLRLTGTTVGSSITYQWYSRATAAGSPSIILGATTGNYLATVPTSTYYFCVVKCTTSGLVDTSSQVYVNVGAFIPPYSENFERTVPGVNVPCASYTGTWTASSLSSYAYWTTRGAPLSTVSYPAIKNHTTGGSQYLFAGYYAGSYYSGTTAYWWFTPPISLTSGNTYEFSYWYSGSGYSGGSTNLSTYYGTAQTAAGMTTQIIPDVVGINTGTYKQMIGRFVSPSTANYYMGIKVNHTTYTYSGIAIDDIGLVQLPPCTGAPTVGTVAATPAMLCTPGTVALNMDLAGVSKVSGLSYYWFETDATGAPIGGGISSGTLPYLTSPSWTTPSISATKYFRCSVKCTTTGDSTISTVIKVDVGSVTPPYFETFETVPPGSNAPCASYTYSWGAGAYWYTYGTPFSTSYPAINNHTPGGSRYLFAGYYLGTYYSGAAQYWFSPAIKFTAGKLYQLNFWYNGSAYGGGSTNIGAYYGTSQTAAAMTTAIGAGLTAVNTSTYKEYKQKFTSTLSGNLYLGIMVNHTTYSYPGVVIDDIGLQEVPPCSAPVVAGTIVADPNRVCASGGTTNLDLIGSTLATGLIYKWWSAPTATGPWTLTTGSTVPYTTDPLPGNTWFKAVVTCSATGAKDSTAPFMVNVGGYDLPYIEDFESTPAGSKPLCSDATAWGMYYYDAWNVWGATYTGNYGNHTPGGKNHLIGGYYLGYSTYSPSYPSLTDDNYWFTPGLNLRSGYKYDLNFWYIGTHPSYPTGNRMGVFYGKAQSVGSMTGTIAPFTVRTNTSYTNFDTIFTVPSNGVYYLGFKKSNGTVLGSSSGLSAYGVAFDDINLNYAPCDGTPFGGTVMSSVGSGTPVCKNTPMTLTDIGATINLVPGIKYQWERRGLSIPPATWTSVAGAKDTVLSADTLIGYEYRLAVTCTNSGSVAYSSIFQLPAIAPHPPVTISPSTSPITFCLGDSVKFNATTYTGAIYDWSIDSAVVYGWKFSDMGATLPGTYMVKVTSPLSPCPTWSNKVKLVANDPGYTVNITTPADSIICAGSSMILTATSSKPGLTYKWRKDNVDIPGATSSSYVVTTGGYYRVTGYDGVSSCPAVSRNILITVKPNPPAIITVPGGTTTACENEGVMLNANTGGFSYEWQKSGSTIVGWTDSSQLIKTSGVYKVKVRSSDGCVSVSSGVTVNILPAPTPIIVKSGLTLSTTLSYITYQWIRNGLDISGATSPTLTLTKQGLYKVRVTNANNCIGESPLIEVMDQGLNIGNVSITSDNIKIYPNPTQSKVFIESPVAVTVKVTDIVGKVVVERQETKEVDLGKLADGVYLFTISDAEGNELIKQQRVTKISNK